MLKGGTAKAGLPKPGLQERAKQASAAPSSSTTAIRTSRSSNTLASDLRLHRLKRASSDDTLAKPALGAAASRMKKTITTGAISDLAEARSRSLSGTQAVKRSGIPAPRELPVSITRDRASLRDQLRTSATKKMVPSSSASSLSTLAKHQQRGTVKSRGADGEGTGRGLLECQVKELLAEAKAKDFEISKLRTELQRCRAKASSSSSLPGTPSPSTHSPKEGQSIEALLLVEELREKNGRFQRELAGLREENQSLKEKLFSLEATVLSDNDSPSCASPSRASVNGLPSDNLSPIHPVLSGSPLKTSTSSSSDLAKGTPSPDSSEFEKVPSRSSSVSSGAGASQAPAAGAGQRDVWLASLTEQIQRMEESQHSTSEELQATLQELADQQQVVQELTAENERLAREKGLLQTSMQQQRERLELLAQKNEALAARLQEQAQAQAQRVEELGSQGGRVAELEQRYADLVDSSSFEREKLVDIQQQLTGSLRALEQEHHEALGQVCCEREERERLQARLDEEIKGREEALKVAEEQRTAADSSRLANSRLKAQVDTERQKVGELMAMQSTSDSTELQGLLKTAHAERERLEGELTRRRQELLQAQKDEEHARGLASKAEAECQQVQEQAERREQELRVRLQSLEGQDQQAESQIKDLKENIFELEDQVEQQRAVHLHTNQSVLDLESQVKRLDEQKAEVERQLKALNKQMKDEREEWRRFQADLQTAVVVANDIKVEAQQELRSLRRRLQEEQDRGAKLSSDLEQLQGARLSTGATFDTKTAVEGR